MHTMSKRLVPPRKSSINSDDNIDGVSIGGMYDGEVYISIDPSSCGGGVASSGLTLAEIGGQQHHC